MKTTMEVGREIIGTMSSRAIREKFWPGLSAQAVQSRLRSLERKGVIKRVGSVRVRTFLGACTIAVWERCE